MIEINVSFVLDQLHSSVLWQVSGDRQS